MEDDFIKVNFNTKSHEHLMKPNKEVKLSEEEIKQKLKKFKIKDDLFVNEGFKGFGGSPYILINWIPRKT